MMSKNEMQLLKEILKKLNEKTKVVKPIEYCDKDGNEVSPREFNRITRVGSNCLIPGYHEFNIYT